MRYITVILICFGCIAINAQKTNSKFKLKEGCYALGHYLGTPDNTSFWYFKNDSTFINFYVTKENNIRSIRKGKWQYLGDSMLSIGYLPLKSNLLLKSIVEYRAETKGSPDSIYFQGSVKNYDNKPLSYCGIVFDNSQNEFARYGQAVGFGLKGITTDVNGYFDFGISKNDYFGSLGIAASIEYFPLVITTNPVNNYHFLTITVPQKDTSNDIDISKFDFKPEKFRYRPSKPGQKVRAKSNDLLINYISSDKILLLDVLYAARKRQPYLLGPIDELIGYLKPQ